MKVEPFRTNSKKMIFEVVSIESIHLDVMMLSASRISYLRFAEAVARPGSGSAHLEKALRGAGGGRRGRAPSEWRKLIQLQHGGADNLAASSLPGVSPASAPLLHPCLEYLFFSFV